MLSSFWIDTVLFSAFGIITAEYELRKYLIKSVCFIFGAFKAKSNSDLLCSVCAITSIKLSVRMVAGVPLDLETRYCLSVPSIVVSIVKLKVWPALVDVTVLVESSSSDLFLNQILKLPMLNSCTFIVALYKYKAFSFGVINPFGLSKFAFGWFTLYKVDPAFTLALAPNVTCAPLSK